MRYADLVFLGTFGVVVAKWEAVDEAGFRKAVENNEQTLVACEKTPSKLDIYSGPWLTFFLFFCPQIYQ